MSECVCFFFFGKKGWRAGNMVYSGHICGHNASDLSSIPGYNMDRTGRRGRPTTGPGVDRKHHKHRTRECKVDVKWGLVKGAIHDLQPN